MLQADMFLRKTRNGRRSLLSRFAACRTAILAAAAYAELSPQDLAKIAQNPVGNLISVLFQMNAYFNVGPLDGTQNVLNIQPVIPVDSPIRWRAGQAIQNRQAPGEYIARRILQCG